jgi:hypothetical protein
MRCTDFLELYSDYRDGLIGDPVLNLDMSQHLITCRRCMQYDARVARGVTVLKTLSDLEPSRVFRRELAGRLAEAPPVRDEPVIPAPAGIMVALMLLTAVAFFLWEAGTGSTQARGEPPETPRPFPVAVANPGPPFVSFGHLAVPAFGGEWHTPGAAEGPLVLHTAALSR